ncbi:hypothetical protein [Rhodococcus wratislaviensis]|uniref:Uncharacterized protein n=1 Tax=Rhodococcus wratislaviensis NBRC 100605 TaxID=1219028 RepID=X0PZC5_RHOWR|nr:hypothetical protein [Rhodococcus wratislaviensis]GAF43141.1 hypothetical protein RW1_006_00330 [Rhodococcus wratislaviensis NBRC 100605]
MFIEVSSKFVALRDTDDLSRFHVEVPADMTLDGIDSALRAANLGRVNETGTAIKIKELRARVGEGTEPQCVALDEMIAYATVNGWVSSDGGDLSAHIIRNEPKK